MDGSVEAAIVACPPRAPAPGRFSLSGPARRSDLSIGRAIRGQHQRNERRDMADKPVRTDKATAVAELTEQFRSSTATVLTEYRGLTVAQLKSLRRALGTQATYAVAKNTLAKRAAEDAGIAGLDDLFTGPTALAFVSGDVVEAAKGLREFAKTHPLLVIKGGVFEGKPLSAAEVTKLADLESREVLLAKLAGAMKANL